MALRELLANVVTLPSLGSIIYLRFDRMFSKDLESHDFSWVQERETGSGCCSSKVDL